MSYMFIYMSDVIINLENFVSSHSREKRSRCIKFLWVREYVFIIILNI